MSGGTRLPDAVQWYEGMLLAPQHFQQLVARQDRSTAYHLNAAQPFHWGVLRLRHNVESNVLSDGVFRIEELEAVMPDGLVVQYDKEIDRDLAVNLAPYIESRHGEPVTVHLRVPLTIPNAEEGGGARYQVVSDNEVEDENAHGFQTAVRRLRPVLSLQDGEVDPSKFTSFPIARFRVSENRLVSADYTPPMLRLSITDDPSGLGVACKELAETLRRKIGILAKSSAFPTQSAMHNLFAALPPFETMVHSGASHPYQVYIQLCHMVGCVAGLREGPIPNKMPDYRHDDLRAGFRQALDYINGVIAVIRDDFLPEPFVYDQETDSFHCRLPLSWIKDGDALFIGVRGGDALSGEETERWVADCCIVTEEGETIARTLEMGATREIGAERGRIERPEDYRVTPVFGMQVFAVAVADDYVRPGGLLRLKYFGHAKGRRKPVEIVLFVPNKARGGAR